MTRAIGNNRPIEGSEAKRNLAPHAGIGIGDKPTEQGDGIGLAAVAQREHGDLAPLWVI